MHGICLLNTAVIKAKPAHDSEIVNQLLFGETFLIEERNDNWVRIVCLYDGYTGWLHHSQATPVEADELENTTHHLPHFAISIAQPIKLGDIRFVIPIGSTLPNYNPSTKRGSIAGTPYFYGGKTVVYETTAPCQKQLLKYAKHFLNTPYLWGGRSPFGIDCSGLTQVCAKLAGFALLRDAWQQAQQGEPIAELSKTQVGDLAFFSSNAQSERITHVGIVGHKNQIIHSAGKVRIDTLTKQGILNNQTKTYTHCLRLLRRL